MSTIRDPIRVYLDGAIDVSASTRRKLGFLATSWERRTNNPQIEAIGPDTFAAFRAACRRDGLAPITIERSIGDILTVLKASGLRPERGRPLKIDDPDPQCPTLTALGKWYVACNQAIASRLDWCNAGDYLRAFAVVGYWTGFRLADLFTLSRDEMLSETIVRRANKTSKKHEMPNCSVVRRHVETLPARSGPLFSAGRTCPTHLRDWMKAVAVSTKVDAFTPQNLRVGAVNGWHDAGGAEAAGTVHGEALDGRGALRWYLQRSTPLKVLTLAAPQFVWPSEMLLPAERDSRDAETDQLISIAKRLRPEQLANLRRVALAFAD